MTIAAGVDKDVGRNCVRWRVSTRILRIAAMLFALIAMVAGGLQFAAYLHTDWPRHLVLAVFASSVGATVLIAVLLVGRR